MMEDRGSMISIQKYLKFPRPVILKHVLMEIRIVYSHAFITSCQDLTQRPFHGRGTDKKRDAEPGSP